MVGTPLTVTIVVVAQPVAVSVKVMVELHAVVVTLCPVTTPVPGFMAAQAELLLSHVPVEASLNDSVLPSQMGTLPVMAAGSAATVIVNVVKHPPNAPVCVYVMVVVEPTAAPVVYVTMPLLTVATVGSLLVQLPELGPPPVRLREVVPPGHM